MNRKVEIKTIDDITLKGTIISKRIEDDDSITYGLIYEAQDGEKTIDINEKEIFLIAYV